LSSRESSAWKGDDEKKSVENPSSSTICHYKATGGRGERLGKVEFCSFWQANPEKGIPRAIKGGILAIIGAKKPGIKIGKRGRKKRRSGEKKRSPHHSQPRYQFGVKKPPDLLMRSAALDWGKKLCEEKEKDPIP